MDLKIVKFPADSLTKKCPEYDYLEFTEDLKIATSIYEHMLKTNVQSLSAPNFGINKRFFVLKDGPRFCFDPRMTNHGHDIWSQRERCVSLDGVLVAAPRWRVIDVEYVNENSVLVRTTLKAAEARAFQHELDHLNGLLLIKRVADHA